MTAALAIMAVLVGTGSGLPTGRNFWFRNNRTVISRSAPGDPPDRGQVYVAPDVTGVHLEGNSLNRFGASRPDETKKGKEGK